MGGIVLGILAWQEGGESVAALIAVGAVAHGRAGLVAACAASGRASRRCSTPTCSSPRLFRFGITGQLLQQIALGGTMIALPIYLQMVLEYNAMEAGLSLAPALAQHVRGRAARREARRATAARAASSESGSRCCSSGSVLLIPIVPARRLRAGSSSSRCHRRLRPRPAGLPAEQLHAVADLRGAGQRSRGRELGRRLVRPVVRPRVRRRHHARRRSRSRSPTWPRTSTVLPPAEQQQVADVLEDDAEIMSNTAARGAPRRTNPRTSRPRSSASTPTPGPSRCRSRCSSRSSPACSGCSSRSA